MDTKTYGADVIDKSGKTISLEIEVDLARNKVIRTEPGFLNQNLSFSSYISIIK